MAKDEYWFNTRTNEVEIGKQSLSLDRLGPFTTLEEAQNAVEIVAKRARALRQEEAEDWSS
jgi:hypothetical protein